MSKLDDLRETTKIKIKENDWIEIWKEVTIGDALDANSTSSDDDFLKGVSILKATIKSWSFDDEINDENIRKLPATVLEDIQANIDIVKKNTE